MFRPFIQLLRGLEGKPQGPATTVNAAEFHLKYRDIEVGRLYSRDGKWCFEYSERFKQQDRVAPLADFPNKEKIYEMEDLWPFFASRIPSFEQPRVRETIRSEKIDRRNSAELLRRFGKRSISNPFVLESV